MKSPNVTIEVCVSLIREFLSGYRGYPNTEAGEKRFAFALQENCLSVSHVRAVLQCFDEGFPTVRQIHDSAFGLRAQFEASEIDQRKEWERKYGKPQPFNQAPADMIAMHWQAFRDMLYYTEGPGQRESGFWEAAKIRDFNPKYGHQKSIDFVRHQAKALGWPAVMALAAPPEPMPYTNPLYQKERRAGGLAPIGAPITQADIDHAREPRKSTGDVDRELDQWEDPDR